VNGAREADQRFRAQLGHQRGDGLGDEVHVTWLEGAQPLQVPLAADRLTDHRADAGLDVDVQPHRPQRDHDVAEQDGRVYRVPAHRLQGDLGNDVWPGACLEHRHPAPRPTVFGQERQPGA
jgi:hypothetical protein